MMTATAILAAVAGLLFLVSLHPGTNHWPALAVGGLLLSIAVFLLKT